MESKFLSTRGEGYLSDSSLLVTGFVAASANPYDPDINPQGIINMGTAENSLSFDGALSARITCAASLKKLRNIDEAKYGDMTGRAYFRDSLLGYLRKVMRLQNDAICADELVVVNGTGSAVECFAHAICDPGDGVLLIAPYYGGFEMDLGKRAGVRIVQAAATEANNFHVSEAALQAAVDQAREKGIVTKAFVLSRPGNPLGDVDSREELLACLRFANRQNPPLHVLSDEIYLLSIFDEKARDRFVPALSLRKEEVPDWDRLHVVWGFSKDFCASGYRVGVFMSRNQQVLNVIKQIGYFHAVGAPTQAVLAHVLSDEACDCCAPAEPWSVDHFTAANAAKLRASSAFAVHALQAMGVTSVRAQAGFFLWVDLRAWVRRIAQTRQLSQREAELKLWLLLLDQGLYITPSAAFGHLPVTNDLKLYCLFLYILSSFSLHKSNPARRKTWVFSASSTATQKVLLLLLSNASGPV
jgi:aspartate/methionine/tyrosine aminotransferase